MSLSAIPVYVKLRNSRAMSLIAYRFSLKAKHNTVTTHYTKATFRFGTGSSYRPVLAG